LGLGLLAASATTSSAMNCGEFTDPATGTVFELPCLVEIYAPVEPDPPCLCPWSEFIGDQGVIFEDRGLSTGAAVFTSPVDLVALNPQPLPPRALGARFAR